MIPDLLPLAADVDSITIAFEEGSLTTLKIVIGAILFGIALDTRLDDFALAARRPGTIAIGVVAQFLLLPALTFGLTLLLDVRGSVALGMILVACCPPGNVSNILTHRARGDVALSVSMTAVGNVLAIFADAAQRGVLGRAAPHRQGGAGGHRSLRVGHAGRDRAGHRACRSSPASRSPGSGRSSPPRPARSWARSPSSALGAVIVVGVANNWSIFVDYIGVVVIAVFLHDALALLLGYGIAKATRLPDSSTRAMTFEVGIRNAGLGLLLVFTYFDGLGGMALVAAWWGIWDIIAGLAVAQWWRSADTDADAAGGRSMSTILVTGGSGFLGTSVVRGLAEAGHRVVSADLRTPADPVPGVEHLVMDVTDPDAVKAAFAGADVEVVVHLASIVTPGKDSSRALEHAVDVDGHPARARRLPGRRRTPGRGLLQRRGLRLPPRQRGRPRRLADRGRPGARQRGVRLQRPQAPGRGDARRAARPATRSWSRWCCGSARSSASGSTTRSPRCSRRRGC